MQKIFEEYGGGINSSRYLKLKNTQIYNNTANKNGGWIGDAFKDVIDKFLTKAGTAITGA